jgi:N-acetylmuramoyl-L-alanine amidase
MIRLSPQSPLSLLVCGLLLSAATLAHAATIVLDPGHGGDDSGTAPRGMMAEKKATLDVALRASAKLQAAGHRVILTRKSDRYIELSDRVSLSNQTSGKPVFVSLHFNSCSNRSISGLETYYYSRRSLKLAAALHRRIVQATGAPDRGLRSARFYVLRFNRQPSVLLELGFLSHPKEGSKISRSPLYRQKLADAVASALHQTTR